MSAVARSHTRFTSDPWSLREIGGWKRVTMQLSVVVHTIGMTHGVPSVLVRSDPSTGVAARYGG